MFKKFNWGHGVILALASFICFILFMIFVFPNGQQNSEMVSDNYYQEELDFQQVIDAKKNADALPVKPVFNQNSGGISINFPAEIQPEKKMATVMLYRTDDKNLDVEKTLALENDAVVIPRKVLVPGSYTLKLLWQRQSKPYQIDYDILWK